MLQSLYPIPITWNFHSAVQENETFTSRELKSDEQARFDVCIAVRIAFSFFIEERQHDQETKRTTFTQFQNDFNAAAKFPGKEFKEGILVAVLQKVQECLNTSTNTKKNILFVVDEPAKTQVTQCSTLHRTTTIITTTSIITNTSHQQYYHQYHQPGPKGS